LFDGRRKAHARAAALVTMTMTVTGLGVLTAGPAVANPDDLAAAEKKVDRLSDRAAAVEERHDDAAASLEKVRDRKRALTRSINRARLTIRTLEEDIAKQAIDLETGAAGTAAAAEPLERPERMMLMNVTVVSEDTEGAAERVVSTSEKLERLLQKRAEVRTKVPRLAKQEREVRTSRDGVERRLDEAEATLADLEEKAQPEAEAPAPAAAAGSAVEFALSKVGGTYSYGGVGPDAFDCSGLTMAAWATQGVSLPHSSSAQMSSGKQVSEGELQPGDLVFYYSPVSHVGIYVGGGQVVSALNPGEGIKKHDLHMMPFSGAVRPG
jgi:cell wall-associated NlpC family hydrolase